MLRQEEALILTFDETTQAMAAERYCMEHHLPGRLIPVPVAITAGCGLAWKAKPEDQLVLCNALTAAGIQWTSAHILLL